MPYYDYKCSQHKWETFHSMKDESDQFCPECGEKGEIVIGIPMVTMDIQPYRNIIDGKMITSRKQHKEFLHSRGLVESPDKPKRMVEHDYKMKHQGDLHE